MRDIETYKQHIRDLLKDAGRGEVKEFSHCTSLQDYEPQLQIQGETVNRVPFVVIFLFNDHNTHELQKAVLRAGGRFSYVYNKAEHRFIREE